MSQNVLSVLSSRNFIMSYLMFKSLKPFEFIFVHGVRVSSSIIDLHAAVQLCQHHLLKRLFPILHSCLLCQGLIDRRCLNLFLGSLFYSIFLYFFFLYQYHTILITIALQYCLKSEGVMPFVFCFYSLRTALAILGLLLFHIHFWIIGSGSVKIFMGNLIGILLNLQIALAGMTMTILTILILPLGTCAVFPFL